MAELRTKTYFTSDVHLGLQAFDPEGRQKRFVDFLHSINSPQTKALYLLGDIWDFWYEWKEVVPKGSIRVFAAITDLIDAGINVYFMIGNHDIWAYSYFEQMGMIRLEQPAFIEAGGKKLCIGHGDGLGNVGFGYRLLNGIFKCKVIQWLFSALLHPTLAMKLGHAWSKGNRLSRGEKYVWRGADEPLTKWCEEVLSGKTATEENHRSSDKASVDLFIFGHYHVAVDQPLSHGARLVILDSWIEEDSWFCIDEADTK